RLSGRTGLRLNADGRGRGARGLCREDTAVFRALVLRAGRYSAGSSGHTRHAQGDCELAAERRAARRCGDLHDDRHRLLPALGTRLGPLVGIARCEPGLHGTSDGAVSRVRCGCARNCDRTRDARAVDRARPACGTCAVRLDRRAGRINAGRNRTLARRTCNPPNGVRPFGARHAVHKISARPPVRRHGRLWTSSWDGFDPCFAAVVGRQRRRAHAGRGRRRKIRKYEPQVLVSYLAAAFGSFAVAVTVAALFALVVVALLPFRIADVIVAFAPGAQDTMMVLALAMHLDPVYVGAHHLARFLAVSFSVAVVARRLVPREPTRPRRQWTRPGQGTFDDCPQAT